MTDKISDISPDVQNRRNEINSLIHDVVIRAETQKEEKDKIEALRLERLWHEEQQYLKSDRRWRLLTYAALFILTPLALGQMGYTYWKFYDNWKIAVNSCPNIDYVKANYPILGAKRLVTIINADTGEKTCDVFTADQYREYAKDHVLIPRANIKLPYEDLK